MGRKIYGGESTAYHAAVTREDGVRSHYGWTYSDSGILESGLVSSSFLSLRLYNTSRYHILRSERCGWSLGPMYILYRGRYDSRAVNA